MITIDNKEYDLSTFSTEAKQQLEMLVATDNKIRELQRDLPLPRPPAMLMPVRWVS